MAATHSEFRDSTQGYTSSFLHTREVAVVTREDLPVVFLALIINAEGNTSVVAIPYTDDIVSGAIVNSPRGH